MELSQAERRIVERLRRQEQSWRWGRWVMLLMGMFSAAASVAGLVISVPFVHRASEKKEAEVAAAFVLAFFHPLVLAFGLLAVVAFYRAIRDWRGNGPRILLLRLIDEHSKANRGAVGSSQ